MKVVLVAVVFLLAQAGIPNAEAASYEPLLALQAGPTGPENSGLLKYTDGFYYGVSKSGGSYGYGTLYRVNELGEITVLVHFSGNSGIAKGRRPQCGLLDDGNGHLWGTTVLGGVGNFGTGFGTVFRFNPVTWDFTSVASFTGTTGFAKGSLPQGGVQKDANGQIWGTTSAGGSGGNGTIFKIGASNLVFSHVLDFSGNDGSSRGKAPFGELKWDENSQRFLGSTAEGGFNGLGTVFAFNPAANQFTTLA
ncbi:MAG: hypothetical protein JWL81_185, partial [Verrucomicrobiales bacterium]|nr:hypothetical protein [Verrucomicrobiales bacterium]